MCCLMLPAAIFAQAPKKGAKKAPAPKSATEQAFAEFQKVRNAKGAKPDQARFQSLIEAGIAFIKKYPTSYRTNEIAGILGLSYPLSIDSKQPALRAQYLSLLTLEVTNQKYQEGVKDTVKAGLAAIEAAAADFEVRQTPNPQTLATLREKLDALGETPAGFRFLAERERSYAQLLTLMRQTARAEELLQKLASHPEKAVADMARQELSLIEVKKTPFDLRFTALDGKPVDFAKLRGKVVALYFWSSTNAASTKEFERLKRVYSDHRKKGFELVTVSYDKSEDRAKLEKFVKQNRISWPVYFDGKGAKNEFSPKLNVTAVPRLVLFDKTGMLQVTMQGTRLTPELPAAQLDAQVKRLLAPPKKK